MFHVDNNSAVPVMPAVKPVVSAVTSFFTEGGNGVPPTYPGPDWFNIIQSELLAVLAAAGITPDKASNVQLLAAMRALFLDTSQNGADIQDKALFLQNLQLGEAAKRGVGTGANQIPDMRFFNRSIESNGYFLLPSGVIVQWGRVTISGTTTAHITYPIPFPTNRLVLTASPVGSGFTVNTATPVFTNGDRFGCDTSSWGTSNYGVMWIAIGG